MGLRRLAGKRTCSGGSGTVAFGGHFGTNAECLLKVV